MKDDPTNHYGLHHLGLNFPEDKNKLSGIFCWEVEGDPVLQKNWEADYLGLCYEKEHSVRYYKKNDADILRNIFNFSKISAKASNYNFQKAGFSQNL